MNTDLCLTKYNTMSIVDAAMAYAAAGFSLVPVKAETKETRVKGWAADAYTWTPTAQHNGNIGARLYHSGIVTLDIDDLEAFGACMEAIKNTLPKCAKPFWESETARINSGRENRAKLVFLRPDGAEIETHKLSWKKLSWKTGTVFELRAGGREHEQQDLLPPSIHPTGSTYQWVGDTLQPIPKDLLELWKNWNKYEGAMKVVDPEKAVDPDFLPPVPDKYKQGRRDFTSLITRWEETQDLDKWLRQEGYTYIPAAGRYRSPKSSGDSAPGVVILPASGGKKFFCWHASDPFNDGHAHGAFDLLLKIKLNDDWHEALREVRRDLGLKQKEEKAGTQKPIPTTAAEECGYDFTTQQGYVDYVADVMRDKMVYDSAAQSWYIYDDYHYTARGKDDAEAYIINTIKADIIQRQWDSHTTHTAQVRNTTQGAHAFYVAGRIPLAGAVDEISAHVFDDGEALILSIDDATGRYELQHVQTVGDIKTTARVHYRYADYTLEDLPQDLKDFLAGYGDEKRVRALIRMFAYSLARRPEKVCFQLVGENSGTGKSTICKLFLSPFDAVEMNSDELTYGKQNGRATGILQGITHDAIIITEATGTIDEAMFKNLVDTTKTYSGRYCGMDRIERPRRAAIYMHSNKRIRADMTDAYAARAYPIEFETKFESSRKYDALTESHEWGQWIVGLMIHELQQYVEGVNQDKGIVQQIAEICPEIGAARQTLTRAQDFRLTRIMSVIRHPPQQTTINAKAATITKPISTWDVWNAIVEQYGTEKLKEWGIAPGHTPSWNPSSAREIKKDIERAGFETIHGRVQGDRTKVWLVLDAEIIKVD